MEKSNKINLSLVIEIFVKHAERSNGAHRRRPYGNIPLRNHNAGIQTDKNRICSGSRIKPFRDNHKIGRTRGSAPMVHFNLRGCRGQVATCPYQNTIARPALVSNPHSSGDFQQLRCRATSTIRGRPFNQASLAPLLSWLRLDGNPVLFYLLLASEILDGVFAYACQ